MLNTYSSTITSKGQATIPVPIRKKLGIKPGEKIYFAENGKEVVLKSLSDSVDELAGSLKTNIKWNKKKVHEVVGKMLAEHINEQTHRQ